jgi:transcriptional regulator with XRE-family HTH domain
VRYNNVKMNRSPERIEGLREARLRAELTQQRLSDLSGLPRQHVSALENHRLLLTGVRARKIAPHLGAHPAELVVGHAASPFLRNADKTTVTIADFRALVRAYSAARADQSVRPRLRLELIRVVRKMSDRLFVVWGRNVDDAEREARRALEARPT